MGGGRAGAGRFCRGGAGWGWIGGLRQTSLVDLFHPTMVLTRNALANGKQLGTQIGVPVTGPFFLGWFARNSKGVSSIP